MNLLSSNNAVPAGFSGAAMQVMVTTAGTAAIEVMPRPGAPES